MNKKYRASKLILRKNDFEDYNFLNENHYQGWIPSSVRYGLFDGDELIIEMTFGKPRFNKRYDWELLRLCTKKNSIVNGGASRLFKHFCEDFSGSIISYCNESKFNGNIYSILGFTKRGTCNSYHYEKDGIAYNRIQFQKWKLVKQYPQWKDFTEKQIMTEKLGYSIVEEKQATWSLGDKWYIYQITDKRNGKTYIGQHLDRGDDYWGSGTIIRREIAKYGKEYFEKTILVDNIQSQKEADEIELKYINEAKAIGKCEYNIMTTKMPNIQSPRTYNSGYHLSNETKNKISEKLKGNTCALGHKGNTEWKPSEEQRQKISEKLKGNKNSHYRVNTTPNEESKEKNRIAHTGKKASDETKKKQSESLKKAYAEGRRTSLKGTKQSEESNKKRSETMKGKNSHLVKCIETGEIHNKAEWCILGYSKAYEVARGSRPHCKGLHFMYN